MKKIALFLFLTGGVLWGHASHAAAQPAWLKHLLASTWVKQGDEKETLLINFDRSRYFIFKKNGALYDHGGLQLDKQKKSFRMYNQYGQGRLTLTQVSERSFTARGRLQTEFGEQSLDGSYVARKSALDFPVPRSLAEAALYGDLRALQGFLQARMAQPVDGAKDAEISPLGYAVLHQHNDAVQLLLDKGADPNFTGKTGKTPLGLAVVSGNLEAARLLIAKGAKVDHRGKDKVPLVVKALHGSSLEIIKLLVSKGARINALDEHGHLPLHAAMASFALKNSKVTERLDFTRYLVETAKVDPKTVDDSGRNALFYAASLGLEKTVKYLLSKGVDPSVKDKSGKTVFDYAAGSEHKDKILAILAKYKK